ncbi:MULTISPECIES: ABC transporter permease [unclassified Gemella]|uniref:ABC transporter permease n=1 Tax=unclassified Gemella TaxID=2624949 RepID=UPI001073840D|nr:MULTISPECIES: ABC transporter permease [unclassified Gemella]MBF0710644.1 ABC transporter permease [Gemella sp. GL1.1]MBF0746377.1 ABC transporter permease [Gemella sp. 19428wG2_WT2a]NYS27988.1 ABC transporter permease [Gemella sp. GL1]TFU60160.1 ABC transporter permease [Gemella sp. WT2a]
MGFIKVFRKNMLSSPVYIFSLIFLVLLITLSLLAPLIPIDPAKVNISQVSKGPSFTNLFGTDELGRDYFIRVLYGGRISLLVGFLSMLAATTIGVFIGVTAGYFGGWLDSLLMRFLDVLSSIPWLILVIVLSVFLKPGLLTIIIVIGAFSWMNTARLMRGETLALKERDYVQYSKFIGESSFSIIKKHILPFLLPTMLVSASINISSAIMTESALSFLGLGIQPPMASWGSLLQTAQDKLQNAAYIAIIPGLLIALTVYSFNNLGELIKESLEEI